MELHILKTKVAAVLAYVQGKDAQYFAKLAESYLTDLARWNKMAYDNPNNKQYPKELSRCAKNINEALDMACKWHRSE